MGIRLVVVLTMLLTLGAVNAWGEETMLEINTTNFTKLSSSSGYTAYNGDREIDGVTIYSNQVMVQSGKIQFQKSNGILYNKTPLPGNISKISIATPDNLTIYVGEESNPSSTTVQSGNTITGNNKYFAIKASSSATPTTATITITYEAASGGNIDASGSATINFGTNAVNINAASVTGEDNLGYSWKITTAGTTSFTPQPTYSQVGSSSKPATSITFTTTLPKEVAITKFSAKFGGFSSTAGNVTLKVGDTSVGTGKLNATSDVTVTNTTEATGKVLTVTVTNIAKGVKVYSISYTYESVISEPTYTLTNQANPDGYGTISPSSVEDIPKGTTTSKNANTYTVNGTTVTASPSAKTAQYTYAFSEWQNLPATVNGDATVTAVFTRTTNKYTITWKNGDNVLETDNNVEYGATPQYNGATPTKAATAQYTYAFTGWNPAIASVTKDQTYTAQFSQTVNKYTITWKNADGTTLKTEEVAYGTTPSYTGTTPTKAPTEQYTYTHNGWTPSVVAVTGNAEYTATFVETPRTYTITLNTNGGTINAGNVTSYKYGTGATLPTNVTKEHHQFDGWFDNSGYTGTAVTNISTTATGDKEYWAKWTELPKYTVTWSVDGNTTTEEVYSGDKATKAPTIDENNLPCDGADKFMGWTTSEYTGNTAPGTLYPTAADIPAITEPITFYAVFADYVD